MTDDARPARGAPIAFDYATLTVPERSRLATRIVAPRPIAFVSTLSAAGNGNLAPFSFFTAGGSNPPSMVFCAVNDRQGREKDTLQNIAATGEYVINVVTAAMAAGINRASFEYPADVNEFDVSGFTRVPSIRVRPPGVGESPVRVECRLHTILRHGKGPSAGNYIVGEILHVSADPAVCTGGLPDSRKLEQLARLGANWYLAASADSLFEMPRPTTP